MSAFLNRLAAAEKLQRAICYDWCFPDATLGNDPSFGPFVPFGGGRFRAYVVNNLGNLFQLYISMDRPGSRLPDLVPLSKPETLAGLTCFIYSLNTDAPAGGADAIEITASDLEYFEKWQATQ